MPRVQVRGALPALLLLVLLGAIAALVVFASFAVVLPVAAGLVVLGLLRGLWYRLTGRRPPPVFRVATFRTVRVVTPGPFGSPPGEDHPGEEGPVVEALPRTASLEEARAAREEPGPGA
jgi:hypothetical protein